MIDQIFRYNLSYIEPNSFGLVNTACYSYTHAFWDERSFALDRKIFRISHPLSQIHRSSPLASYEFLQYFMLSGVMGDDTSTGNDHSSLSSGLEQPDNGVPKEKAGSFRYRFNLPQIGSGNRVMNIGCAMPTSSH